MAKLDNFGPFQVFWTVSCADSRWNSNLSAALRELDPDWEFQYKTTVRADGYTEEEVIVHFTDEEGNRAEKQLSIFLNENVNESKHEVIRKNVVLATRTFDHKVKTFLKEYVIGNAAGMQVEFYSYKVEFQARGAGHVHGVFWLMTHILERTEWIGIPENDQSMAMDRPKIPIVTETIPNTEVKVYSEQEFQDLDENTKENINLPFRNLTKVFEKLNTEGAIKTDLNRADELALTNMVNHLSTCSLFKGGKYADVVGQVEEVNTHYHTKTCQKKVTKCRFNFKKFPSCRTIIARPLRIDGDEGAEILK